MADSNLAELAFSVYSQSYLGLLGPEQAEQEIPGEEESLGLLPSRRLTLQLPVLVLPDLRHGNR